MRKNIVTRLGQLVILGCCVGSSLAIAAQEKVVVVRQQDSGKVDISVYENRSGIDISPTAGPPKRYSFDKSDEYTVKLQIADDNGALAPEHISLIEPVISGSSGDTGDSHPLEDALMKLINEERSRNGLTTLRHAPALTAAAQRHSNDMAQHSFLSHYGSDGSSPWARIRDAGYQFFTAGENVAAGYSNAEEVLRGWMNSPGHRANMLNSSFCEMGVGYARGDASFGSYQHFWTLDLGCSQ